MSAPAGHAPGPVRVGRYRLLRVIGEGGMGVVHLGLDPDDRVAAVKVLRPHVAGDSDARLRLGREVAALHRLRHPRVAEVVAVDLAGPTPFVATRYVPGPPLEAVVREHGALATPALAALMRGLGEAVGVIHAAGLVHRDIKPSNVLLLDGEPVVIDFGIARAVDDATLTATGMLIGTPGYLAPEVIGGAPAGPSVDWWGWAAVSAFAATGRPPYGRGPAEVVLDRIRRGEADLDGLPGGLAGLLRAALSPDPARRPRPDTLHIAVAEVLGPPPPPSPALVYPANPPTLADVRAAPLGATAALPAVQGWGDAPEAGNGALPGTPAGPAVPAAPAPPVTVVASAVAETAVAPVAPATTRLPAAPVRSRPLTQPRRTAAPPAPPPPPGRPDAAPAAASWARQAAPPPPPSSAPPSAPPSGYAPASPHASPNASPPPYRADHPPRPYPPGAYPPGPHPPGPYPAGTAPGARPTPASVAPAAPAPAPPLPQRRGHAAVTAAWLVATAAALVVAPVGVGWLGLAWLATARATQWTRVAGARRRARPGTAGLDGGDAASLALAFPFRWVGSVGVTAMYLAPWVAVVLLTVWASVVASEATGLTRERVALASAAGLAVLTWYGPGGSASRNGTRFLTAPLLRSRTGRGVWFGVAVLVVVAVALEVFGGGGVSPEWSPPWVAPSWLAAPVP